VSVLIRFLRGYFSCWRLIKKTDQVLVQPFHLLGKTCVEREPYLLSQAAGKSVLHFGFLDSIFLEQKVVDGSLLHTRLSKVASALYGVDIDGQVLDRYRALTGDQNNQLWDIADGVIPPALQQGFDLIFFPEVLEHVPNPGVVLTHLRSLCQQNGAKLCLTVPNAFDMYGFMAAMHGVELIHPDHCYTFTPHTLTRLLAVSGLRLLELSFYNFGSDLAPGLTKAGMVALCEPEET
jgi:hypothetical protein